MGDKNYKSVIEKAEKGRARGDDEQGQSHCSKSQKNGDQGNAEHSPRGTSLSSPLSKGGNNNGAGPAQAQETSYLQLSKKKKYDAPPRMKKYKRLVEDAEYLS